MQESFKNPVSWNVEVGSPREFFRELQDLFTSCGYEVSDSQEPSLTTTAMQNVAEFDGHLQASELFEIRNSTMRIAGWVIASVGLIVFLVGLGSLTPSASNFLFVLIVTVALLFLGYKINASSIRVGVLNTVLKISGEAYQAKASATPVETKTHERSGLYSRARLSLALTWDPPELYPPGQVGTIAKDKFNNLRASIGQIASRYVILKDQMLSEVPLVP